MATRFAQPGLAQRLNPPLLTLKCDIRNMDDENVTFLMICKYYFTTRHLHHYHVQCLINVSVFQVSVPIS
jgi:hypothetical protein